MNLFENVEVNEIASGFQTRSETIFALEDFDREWSTGFTQREILSKPSTPELVKKLMGMGFYVQGSRQKLEERHVKDSDWDLTFPVYVSNEASLNKQVVEMGFNLIADSTDGNRDRIGYIDDLNFKSYYEHKDGQVTLMKRKNERLFRRVWESITVDAFELFVWKQSAYNKGMDENDIKLKRHIFMQNMYSAALGVDNYKKWR